MQGFARHRTLFFAWFIFVAAAAADEVAICSASPRYFAIDSS